MNVAPGNEERHERDFLRRATAGEAMDRPDCDPDRLYGTLRRFELTNLVLTRYRLLIRRHILADMRREPGRVWQFTDLGAGGCDVGRWLVRVCRRERLRVAVRAIEQDARIVQYARQASRAYPEIDVVEADACDPTCWGAPDYLFAQHFLHHLSDEKCIPLLRDMECVAGRRFVVSDLRRSRAAYWAFKLSVWVMARGSFLYEDGLASIRRGFLEGEIREMLKAAGMRHSVSCYRLAPSRWVIAGGRGVPLSGEAGVQEADAPEPQDRGGNHG